GDDHPAEQRLASPGHPGGRRARPCPRLRKEGEKGTRGQPTGSRLGPPGRGGERGERGRERAQAEPGRASARASISTTAPYGSAATSTKVRAGGRTGNSTRY